MAAAVLAMAAVGLVVSRGHGQREDAEQGQGRVALGKRAGSCPRCATRPPESYSRSKWRGRRRKALSVPSVAAWGTCSWPCRRTSTTCAGVVATATASRSLGSRRARSSSPSSTIHRRRRPDSAPPPLPLCGPGSLVRARAVCAPHGSRPEPELERHRASRALRGVRHGLLTAHPFPARDQLRSLGELDAGWRGRVTARGGAARGARCVRAAGWCRCARPLHASPRRWGRGRRACR